jgi:hypothetical protein
MWRGRLPSKRGERRREVLFEESLSSERILETTVE